MQEANIRIGLLFLMLFVLLLSGCRLFSSSDDQKERVQEALEQGEAVREEVDQLEAEEQQEREALQQEKVIAVEAYCGDRQCNGQENQCACAEDCGQCESKQTGFCQSYTCNAQQHCVLEKETPCCGDTVCEPAESVETCFQDCSKPGEKDLSDWPQLAGRISPVVGEKAPSKDVITAAELVQVMQANHVLAGDAKLSKEIDLRLDDFVVIGNPCDNPAAAELLRNEIIKNNQNCDIFKYGEAIIRLYQTSPQTVALLVAGKTSGDTKRAARVLLDFEKHTLKGYKVKVLGTLQKPEVILE